MVGHDDGSISGTVLSTPSSRCVEGGGRASGGVGEMENRCSFGTCVRNSFSLPALAEG